METIKHPLDEVAKKEAFMKYLIKTGYTKAVEELTDFICDNPKATVKDILNKLVEMT